MISCKTELIFKIHKTKNSKIVTLKCNYEGCGKEYSSSTRLNIHERTHVKI